MDKELLIHLPVVAAVARQRSFVGAAGALNMSPSAVSHAVRAVEDRLGEPLFARTTRSVSLTEIGTDFVRRIDAALQDIDEAMQAVTSARGDVRGVLRLNASRVAFTMAVAPVLAALARSHPRLSVEVHTDDALVDIVAQGFDAGVRLGEAVQHDMVAVRLTPPFEAIVVASQAYLDRRGRTSACAELARHDCIGYRLLASGSLYEWELDERGRRVVVQAKGGAIVSDATAARELALAGVGIAYLFEPLVRRDLREGRLLRILPQASLRHGGLFLYFARRASMSAKLRAFIDAAGEASARPSEPGTARRRKAGS